MYAHLVDANLSVVQAVNDSYETLVIPRRTRLGVLSDSDYASTYRVDVLATELARARFQDLASRLSADTAKATAGSTEKSSHQEVDAADNSDPPIFLTGSDRPRKDPIVDRQPGKEYTLANAVTLYADDPVAAQLAAVVKEYDIWNEPTGVTDIPIDQWMRIPLKEG